MSTDQIIILFTGISAMILVAYYFFGKKEKVVKITSSTIGITVDGGYTPSQFEVQKGKPITLKILRKDPSSCLDQLIIPEWNITKALPLNKELEITFTPNEVGEFPFHCGMNMFHGKIIVRE